MHHAAWVIAPLVVAGVLGLSASAKAGKGATLRSVIANLHLPAWLLPARVARAVPGVEVAVAVGLVSPWLPLSSAASIMALLLMLAYWLLIARGLTISPRPTCGCFGEVNQPVSRRTLLRNTLLLGAAMACVALAASGRSAWTLLTDAERGDWLWLALAAGACSVTALVRGAVARTSSSTALDEHGGHDSPTASTAAGRSGEDGEDGEDGEEYVRRRTPEVLLHDPQSGPVTLPELSAERAQLLVFVSCHCASTTECIASSSEWQERLDLVDVRIVFSVPMLEGVGPVPPAGTLVDHRALTWHALELSASPSAVLLGADGYLAGGPVAGLDDVRSFVDDVAQALSEAHTDAAAVGD